MRTWLCRILAVVFLVQSMPPAAWAGRSRASRRDRQLDRQVAAAVQQQYPYDAWKQEAAELEKLLQEKDLTADERQFAQLELQIAQTQVEQIDKLNEADSSRFTQINALYAARLEALRVEETALEKKAQLRSFYQKAQSLAMIQASIYALHKLAQESKTRIAQAQAARNQANRQYAEVSLGKTQQPDPASLSQPLVHQPVSVRVNTPPAALDAQVSAPAARSRLLEAWAHNTITLEEIVEYMDPVEETVSVENISMAAELLFNIFYNYNAQASQLAESTIQNATWLAKRLKFRAQHQMYVLEQQARAGEAGSFYMIQARGNLMRLAIQVDKFLKLHPSNQEESALVTYDRQLSEFAPVQRELAALRGNVWPVSPVGNALAEAVQQNYQAHPAQDSRESVLLTREFAYVTDYLIQTGNTNRLSELVALVNHDKSTFHGKNEIYVSAVFGSIFNALMAYPISNKTQRNLRQLLECAAAPVCHYHETRLTNAVNVRTQALAVASMLRQVAKTHHIPTEGVGIQPDETEITHLNEELFEDAQFRATMAAFTVDLYGPIQSWNVTEITRYGLTLEELQKYSNYLARIYESFLPVPEPKVTITTLKEGIYKNCWVREIDAKHLVQLTSLNKTGSVIPATSESGYSCKELTTQYNKNRYGGFDTAIVHDSRGYIRGMLYFNPYNREQAMNDLAGRLMLEVATWYLWGAAFKGMGYLWKGARALTAASEAAAKASDGMRLMRFNSKFTQVWKLSTNGWQTEMGVVALQQQGEKIYVEMARPGYQGYITLLDKSVLQGHSLKSLKGRILLRRAIQRDIYANLGRIPQDLTAGPSTRLIGASRAQAFTHPLTKAEQTAVQQEQPLVRAVTQELNEGRTFDAVTAPGTPYTLYHPIKFPQPVVDLSTRLPEGLMLDPRTGNVISRLSGQYLGTIASYTNPNPLAYNMAAGITQSPSAAFTGRLIANHFPIIGQMDGLTKFVLTMTVLDQPFYYWYVKPYMTDFAERQDKEFARTTGFTSTSKKETNNASSTTVLNGLQKLMPTADNPLGATLQGVFLGVNQLLNYVLPSPIQTARQWMFKKTTEAVAAVDDPIRAHLQIPNTRVNEMVPLPGQVLSFPLIMASDPSPVYNEATRTNYKLATQDQQFKQGMKEHFMQDTLDEELNLLNESDRFMQENREILAALPGSQKELKRVYKVFEQDLKKIKRTVEKDPQQAQGALNEARQKFVNTHADIMTRASVAYVDKLLANLPNEINFYKENYLSLFTAADEEQVRNNYTAYCVHYKQDLIELFTAQKRALETKQDVQALQVAALQKSDRHIQDFLTRRTAIENELNERVNLANQIKEEWEQDFKDICPSRLLALRQEVQDEFASITGSFETNINAALEHVKDARTLAETYRQLKTKREQEFDTFKQYWVGQNPFYESFFNRTLSVVEAEKQAQAAANAPFRPGQARTGVVLPWQEGTSSRQSGAGTWVTP